MKTLRFLSFTLLCVLISCSLSSCESDDEEEDVSIVGNTYKSHEFYLDENGWGWQYTTTINFISSSSCEIKSWGYDYMDYEKEGYSWTEQCSYTLSGNIITLKDSPFYYRPKDEDFKNCGSYLERMDNKEKFFKQ